LELVWKVVLKYPEENWVRIFKYISISVSWHQC